MPAARDPLAAAAAARIEGKTGRERLFFRVYFLLFKVGVKVNAPRKEKFLPRAQLLISRYHLANLETARWSAPAIR